MCVCLCVPEFVYTTYIPGAHRGQKSVRFSWISTSSSRQSWAACCGHWETNLGLREAFRRASRNYDAKHSTAVDSGLSCQISTKLKLLICYGKFILSYELFSSFCETYFRSPHLGWGGCSASGVAWHKSMSPAPTEKPGVAACTCASGSGGERVAVADPRSSWPVCLARLMSTRPSESPCLEN